MQKITLGKFRNTKRGLLLASTLFSVVMYAQSEKEIAVIRAASDMKGTQAFQKLVEKRTLTVKQLQAKAKQLNIKFSGEVNGRMYQLVGFDEQNRPLYYTTDNADAAEGTGATILNDESGLFKLDGEGITVYEWDGGKVRTTHREFGNRASQGDNASSLSAHATHVGGTMIASGEDGKAKGMAYKANLKAYDWNSDIAEMTAAATNGALMSNHSYGYVGGFTYNDASGNLGWHWYGGDEDTEFKHYGQYLDKDASIDYIITKNPYYLPVKAAGNPRGDGPEPGGGHYVYVNGAWTTSTKVRQKNGGVDGFDTLNHSATGKNYLVVAAAHKLPNGYNGPQDVKVASFSGFGPTDDGRIKPDITGIGVDLYSTNSTSNTAYTTMSGTSMASPNVTGNLALLQQHYKRVHPNDNAFMKSATLRALVLHTAKEAGDAPGPDYKHGWGLMDAQKAAETISAKDKYTKIQEETLSNATTKEYDFVADGSEPLKVTIAWVDPRPETLSDSEVLDDPTRMLVNDLDIKIVKDGIEYLPWVLDPVSPASPATKGDNIRDNVEQIVIDNPTPGATYKLIVSHKATLRKNKENSSDLGLENAESQDFSLIVTGLKGMLEDDIAVEGVKVAVDSNSYSVNTPVEVTYINKGTETIQDATITVTVKNKATGNILETKEINVTSLSPDAKEVGTVTFDFTQPFVTYDIQAKAELRGDRFLENNEGNAKAYTTVVDLTSAGTSHRYDFETDFGASGWSSEDKDNNGKTWYQYGGSNSASFAKKGTTFAINFADLSKGSDDWLFSNPLRLKGGDKYVLSFNARKIRTHNEPLQVFMGNAANSQAMTKEISPVLDTSVTSYEHYIYEITPEMDGVFYFGFNQKVNADKESYAVLLDDVVINRSDVAPEADFLVAKTTSTTFEDVTLKNSTIVAQSVPTNYTWTITPNTVTYVNGSATSHSPIVRFNEEGKYQISLKATNQFGEDTETKSDYITVKNIPAEAKFSANSTTLFEGEKITFSNSSTGNPTPTSYKWVITPADGVTYAQGSSDTSKNPEVIFNKKGNYTVSLTATSPLNESTETKSDYITVKTYYESVRNLTHEFDPDAKRMTLKWVRPVLLDTYEEGFENGGAPAPNYTFFDGNADGKGWFLTSDLPSLLGGVIKFARTGTYGMASLSYDGGAIDADNWMITDRLTKGSEVLRFYAYALYPEDLEVYVVPAPASGNSPTLAELQALPVEQRVFDRKLKNTDFQEVTVDLKGKTNEDFFLAFFHKTKKEADSWYLAIDDLSLGYDNSLPATNTNTENFTKPSLRAVSQDYMEKVKRGELLEERLIKENSVKDGEVIAYGVTTYPKLVGYTVTKNDAELVNITDPNILVAGDSVAGDTGVVKYDVVAVYSNGGSSAKQNSDKETVVVDLIALAVDDVNTSKEQLVVYPNPSTGKFIIDAGKDVSSFDAKVYDLSGKLVLSKVAKGQKLDIDLTAYGKGVYILNVKAQNGKNVSVKLMVK